MARKNGNGNSTELVKQETNPIVGFNPEVSLPDYLKGDEKTGMEALGRDDFRIPEIKLLQPLSPEVKTFQGVAIPGEFWHTGMMKSLGKEFTFIPCILKKRVVLWRPKNDQGGGILAVSDDGMNWKRGGDTRFTVKLKDIKEPIVWDTRKNVKQSGLLEFGSSNPNNENSPPAAVLYYEYLNYLPTMENASPVIQRVFKTGIESAKYINSYFLLQKKPIYVHAIKCFVDEKSKDGNDWFVPRFAPVGYTPKEVFETVKELANRYADLDVDIEQEDVIQEAATSEEI